ncbi:AzlC family ABC transporter permease [Oceaniovalibus sp. ACAM 378]|uniref:AzlC family ABC transporter permease n=1 Tax=Oceaniovalibus sp. ACAM 378 TaxID=2599923 RepID=UPI0011D6866D|nr:AzlC family ABC transporter permease [Oceaniovalibus sp. ACAM 378]TYB87114.1 branched-chain amino acid ABC transporter permease [Oceaniovalibus sp. ACAM 378]
MPASTSKSVYLRGIRDSAPFAFVIVPFALLFGVVATEAGLTLAQMMGFNVLVIAGASQFAAVALMDEGAPLWIVVTTALVVNLRMAMYSASLVPHLGRAPFRLRAFVAYLNFDQTYAAAAAEYERLPDMSLAEKLAYFFGVATPIVPLWYLMALVGALLGTTVPMGSGLDFALPITFIGIAAPMLRTPAHVAAAGASVVVALLLAGLPSGLGLLVAAGCAMVVGVAVETWSEKQ